MRWPYRELPRNVKALGLVSLANDAGSDMVLPLLPAFVTQVLGLGPAFLGTLEGIAESTASILKLVAGWHSDRIRRRKAFALAGYGLSNLVRPLIGLATAGWHVLLLRFADRVGKGIRTSPRDAIVAAAVGPQQRGMAFGFHRAMDNLGATIGPLCAALLLWLFPGHLRTVLLLSVIPGVAAVLILATRVREARREEAPPPAPAPAVPSALAGGVPAGAFRTYLAAVVLFTLGNSSDVFLALRAQELGVAVALVPVVWTVLNLVRAFTSTPGGQLSDRIGRRPSIIAGWLLYAAVYLGFGLARSAWQVWALFAVYGIYYGLVEGPERALVADLVASDQRGRAFGWFHLCVGIGALPASLIFGLVWRAHGAGPAFTFGAIMALAASAVLLSVKRGALAMRAPSA
jgi:MFS family permease